jgi:hypothetical protein
MKTHQTLSELIAAALAILTMYVVTAVVMGGWMAVAVKTYRLLMD